MPSRLAILGLLLLAPTVLAQDLPRVYIEAIQREEAGDWKTDSVVKDVDFGSAIAAALMKKKVPVAVVADVTKSKWTIKSVSAQRRDSTVTKVASTVMRGPFGGSAKFKGTFQVIDNESSVVIFAYSVKKNNFQSAAEAFAKHFKKDLKKKRKRRR